MGMESQLEKLKESAAAVVKSHSHIRTDGAVASLRTQQVSMETAMANCVRLHKLGYYLDDISGLREKHVSALVQSWHADGFSNKTIQNNYSRLKIFCGWLGREGIVSRKGAVHYLEGLEQSDLRVNTVTTETKGWTGNGVDVIEKIRLAYLEDVRFGLMMEMGLAFGLRRKEQIKLKPWHAVQAGYLHLDGSITKGGRFRAIPIESGEYGELQKGSLAKAKKWCKRYEALGWPGLTFEQSVNRYKHLVRRLGFGKEDLGVCMHGLRAEYAENMAMLRGLIPPSLGGSVNQMPKEQRVAITAAVSGLMGHGPDGHTIGAYFGTFVNYKKVSGLGGMVGPIVLDAAGELVAQIYCNPALVKGTNGNYRRQSEAEIAQVVINAVIFKGGEETEKLALHEFLEKHGATGGNRLQQMLEARGLEAKHPKGD